MRQKKIKKINNYNNMSKKNKGVEVSAEDKLQQVKNESVAKQIEVVLRENVMGLQPFLDVSNFGIMPRVRLAAIPKEVKKDEAKKE